MKRKVAKSLLSLSLITVLLVGCGGQSSGETTGNAKGGTIDNDQIVTVAMGDQLLQDWDPAITYGTDSRVFFNVYETLMRSTPEGDYENVLATDYSKSDDGLVWEFKLRENVKFHDGTDFNAEAVKYSIDRTKGMQKGASYIWDPVKEINIIDDLTVQFVLNYAVDLRELVSCQFGAFIYAPSAGEDYDTSSAWFYEANMCGTGPYMLQDFAQDNHVVLTKFEDYWGGWDGNHLEKILFKSVQESTTRRQMVEGGEADIAYMLTGSDADAMSADTNLTIEATVDNKNLQCFFNTLAGPLVDKRVRQALAYSYPYQDVIDYVAYGKYGNYPKDVVAPATLRGTTEAIPYEYNLDKARSLLEEAGCTKLELTASYHNADEDTKKILELWKSELAKLNVTLNIEANSWEVVYNRAKSQNPEDRADIFVAKTFADTCTAYCMYSTSAMTNAGWNFSGFGNEEIDQAITAAYQEGAFDTEKSDEMMREVGAQLAEECFMMNLMDMKNISAVNDSFHGFIMNPAYESTVFFYDCYKE